MGKGTESLQMMQDKIHAENERVVIPVPVGWLANPHSIGETRLQGEISASSVGFVVKGDMVGWRPVKGGIKLAGVWYQVESFANVGPDSSIAVGWATKRASAAANQHAATAQDSTAPAPINATLWGALHSRALCADTHKRSALTAKETTSHSAVGAQGRRRPQGRHRRGGEENKQDRPRRPLDQPKERTGQRSA